MARLGEVSYQPGKTQISPLRCAPVEMTKGRGALPGIVVAEQNPLLVPKAMTVPAADLAALIQQLLSPEATLSPLSSRPERSVVERSLCGCSFLEMFFCGANAVQRLWSIHVRKRAVVGWQVKPQVSPLPSPLSSRPERSVVERSLCGC